MGLLSTQQVWADFRNYAHNVVSCKLFNISLIHKHNIIFLGKTNALFGSNASLKIEWHINEVYRNEAASFECRNPSDHAKTIPFRNNSFWCFHSKASM